MRRIAFGLVGAAVVGVGAAFLLSSNAPVDGAGARLISAAAEASGLRIEANGATRFFLLPTPHVAIDGVSVSTRGEPPFAAAPEVTATLRVGALLMGRVEFSEITLSRPQIAVDRAPLATVAAKLKQAGAGAPPAIRLVDARISWGGRSVDEVSAGLAWSTAGGPTTLSGYGRFAGRPVEASAQIGDLAALAEDRRAPARIRFEGAGLRVMFDGEAEVADRPRLIGEISARADRIGEVMNLFGASPPAPDTARWSASLAGHGVVDSAGLAVSSAEFDLSGRSFLGAARLTAGADGRPSVEATFDVGSLDLKPFIAALMPEITRSDGSWSSEPIDFRRLEGWTLDLRLSADAIKLGRVRLGATAATVAVARGGLDLSIGEASAYGGSLGGRLSVEPGPGGSAKVRIEGAGSDLAIDETLKLLVAKPPIEGALQADLALEGQGTSAAAIVRSLSGRATGRVTDGVLEGVGRSRTLSLAGLRGRMPFATAEARMAIADGVAQAEDIAIAGPEATFSLSGAASLVTRDMRLKGWVRPAGRGWTLPVVVEGPLSAPKLRPDLSRKSPRGEAALAPAQSDDIR